MSMAYIKAPKKFISKSLVMKNLKLQDREFDRLVTLCGVHPYIPKNRQKVDEENGFYYKVYDANKLIHSHVYKTMMKNKSIESIKKRYEGTGFEYKIANLRYKEYNYVDLIKDKYKTFAESVDGLNVTMSNLYLARMLGLYKDSDNVIKNFEDFVIAKRLLECSFMSKSGIYNQISIGKIRVTWFVPYPGASLQEIIEEKKDIPRGFRWKELTFLDFVSSSDDESSSSESEMEEIVNDDSKIDISLLSYSLPLLDMHFKLVLYKLGKLHEPCSVDHSKIVATDKAGIFSGILFWIDIVAVGECLRLIVPCLGGKVVGRDEKADVCVCESADEVNEGVIYVQPQYVFDCLNRKEKLDHIEYCVGKVLPKHVSPFRSIEDIVSKEVMMTMSKKQRYNMEDVLNRFEDVEYEI
ncbi:ribosomal biogenesis protein [Ordospora colligata]|nr:ribosomal biogenesis protein [Ordospora colligata]